MSDDNLIEENLQYMERLAKHLHVYRRLIWENTQILTPTGKFILSIYEKIKETSSILFAILKDDEKSVEQLLTPQTNPYNGFFNTQNLQTPNSKEISSFGTKPISSLFDMASHSEEIYKMLLLHAQKYNHICPDDGEEVKEDGYSPLALAILYELPIDFLDQLTSHGSKIDDVCLECAFQTENEEIISWAKERTSH